MKKLLIAVIVITVVSMAGNAEAWKSRSKSYSDSYNDGYSEGYTNNPGGIKRIAPLPKIAPIPRINESPYTRGVIDGYKAVPSYAPPVYKPYVNPYGF